MRSIWEINFFPHLCLLILFLLPSKSELNLKEVFQDLASSIFSVLEVTALIITESKRLEETSGDIESSSLLKQPPYNGSHRKVSREGDSIASLGSLFQSSVTPHSKEVLPHVQMDLPCSSLCSLPFALLLGTTRKNLAPST